MVPIAAFAAKGSRGCCNPHIIHQGRHGVAKDGPKPRLGFEAFESLESPDMFYLDLHRSVCFFIMSPNLQLIPVLGVACVACFLGVWKHDCVPNSRDSWAWISGLDVLIFLAGPELERHSITVKTWNLLLSCKVWSLFFLFSLFAHESKHPAKHMNVQEIATWWDL